MFEIDNKTIILNEYYNQPIEFIAQQFVIDNTMMTSSDDFDNNTTTTNVI